MVYNIRSNRHQNTVYHQMKAYHQFPVISHPKWRKRSIANVELISGSTICSICGDPFRETFMYKGPYSCTRVALCIFQLLALQFVTCYLHYPVNGSDFIQIPPIIQISAALGCFDIFRPVYLLAPVRCQS